jgi:hypothetical protein
LRLFVPSRRLEARILEDEDDAVDEDAEASDEEEIEGVAG